MEDNARASKNAHEDVEHSPKSAHDDCHILYHDIGDYLKRGQKLKILRETGSIAGIEDFRSARTDYHLGSRKHTFKYSKI